MIVHLHTTHTTYTAEKWHPTAHLHVISLSWHLSYAKFTFTSKIALRGYSNGTRLRSHAADISWRFCQHETEQQNKKNKTEKMHVKSMCLCQ